MTGHCPLQIESKFRGVDYVCGLMIVEGKEGGVKDRNGLETTA